MGLEKSTIGRSKILAELARLSPRLAAELGVLLFARPPAGRTQSFVERPDSVGLAVDGTRIRGYRFGLAGPAVVLVHGWGGAAAQFRALVGPLCRSGFRVFAFDAPAHGQSSGRFSSVKRFSRVLQEFARVYGSPDGIVAHSFGCAAATLALVSGLSVRRAVFISPLVQPRAHFARFAQAAGLNLDMASEVAERRFATRWWEVDIPSRARELRQPLLVIHDRADRTTPLLEAEALVRQWPGAELRVTDGLGHRQVLSNASVIGSTLEFLRPCVDVVRA